MSTTAIKEPLPPLGEMFPLGGLEGGHWFLIENPLVVCERCFLMSCCGEFCLAFEKKTN